MLKRILAALALAVIGLPAIILGGMAFLNTWDILLGAAVIVFSYALAQVREEGWGWERIEDIFLLAIPVGILAFLIGLHAWPPPSGPRRG